MDVRRLKYLVELARLGSMREVADTLATTTSTVSQQVAALAREVGTPLVEPDGRRVRLTPAGERLAAHGVQILAAVEAAHLDLDPAAAPSGVVRVGAFRTAVSRAVLPVADALASSHPAVSLAISEYEPLEAFELLGRDRLDLAVTYDYDLAPRAVPPRLLATPLWTTPWGLGVPATDTSTDLASYADRPWILDSRNSADEEAVRTLASLAGFTPRLTHWIDALDLVEELIDRGHGVGLLPADRPTRASVRVLPLTSPPVTLRAYAVVRAGREAWPPLRLVLDLLTP